jgi:hypothetical protein
MSTETTTPKKSILTRAMLLVSAKEDGEGTEETTTQKMLIKKIAIGAGAVVAGTAAVTVALKLIASRMEDVVPEEETVTED